ncbi:MAG: sigma 54-interacting transcriptional regulator [Deltaproteobacteria bacterium]
MVDRAGTTTRMADSSDGILSLLVVSDRAPVVAPLGARPLQVGRSSTSDLQVDDPSISRDHAVFRVRDGAVEIEDLGSVNGTMVRGVRIAPRMPTQLSVGESVSLGTVVVVVQRRSGSLSERLRPEAPASIDDALVARLAKSPISVLLLGETGVGKEVMAERLHVLSPRKDRPLVKLNCAALMTSVLESELFGHEKGSFTGAVKDKPGLVEAADTGTLFLDEIGEADLAIQAKLLRVLESRETQRVGALKPRIVDVRFLAATNRDPAEQIAAGTLRADLYYRLAGFTLTIPPLRDRLREVPTIVATLLARRGAYTIERAALDRLARHGWPGNVRELRNVLDRAIMLAESDRLALVDIEQSLAAEPPRRAPGATPARSGDPERDRILEALDACGGNQTMAAESLGMSRRALVYRLQAWGLTKPRRR